MTKTSDNGIFYMVVVEVDQRYIDVCSGKLNVTCVVGKTEIPIHQEIFNRCTKTKEESPEDISYLNMSIIPAVLFFTILAMGVGCAAGYRQSKNVICCRRCRAEDEFTFERRVKEIFTQSKIQDKESSTHDVGREECHDMILR